MARNGPFIPPGTPDIQNPRQLTDCLLKLMVTDNTARRQAEFMLRKYCLNARCLSGLYEQLQSHPGVEVRHMAGILLRVKLKTLWENLDVCLQNQMKAGLMTKLVQEPSHPVRKAIATSIGEIAVLQIPSNLYPQLQNFMGTLVQHARWELREVGIQLFLILLERIPENMTSSVGGVVQVFLRTLRDSSQRVVSVTLQAIEHLLKVIMKELPDVDFFVPLVRPIVEVLSMAIKTNADYLPQCFSLLDDIGCVRTELPAFNQCVPHLAKFMIGVSSHDTLIPFIRRRAAVFLSWALKFNTELLCSTPSLIEELMDLSFMLLVCPEGPEVDEDTPSLYKEGTSLLDEICCSVPSVRVFPRIVPAALKMVNQGPNLNVRIGGLTILGVMAEGCYEKCRANLDKLVPLMVRAYQSPNVRVRQVAVMAIVNYAEYCLPEMNDFAASIIPFLVQGLNDPVVEVRIKICLLIDTYCQNVPAQALEKFSNLLLGRLFTMLKNPTLNEFARTCVVTSIGTIAETLKRSYMQYFQPTMDAMNFILTHVPAGSDHIVLRGRALEVIGVVARSVGPETFGPFVDRYMRQAFSAVRAIDDGHLREYSLNFIQNIAHCLGVGFKQYAQPTLELIFRVLQIPDGIAIKKGGLGAFLNPPKRPKVATGTHQVDWDRFNLRIRTSVVDEKCAAYDCVGQLAMSLGRSFMPYYKPTMDRLRNNINYYSAPIRRKVILAMHRVLTSVCPRPITPQMPPEAYRFAKVNFNELMKLFVVRLTEDEDKEAVAHICNVIYFLCRDFGITVVEDSYARLAQCFVELLMKNTQCYLFDSKVFDDVNADHDNVLFDSMMNAIDWVGKTVGQRFEPHYRQIFPLVMKYQDHRAFEDRVTLVGTLAEMTIALKQLIVPYAQNFINPVFQMAKNDPHDQVKRNCFFCLGLVAFHAPQLVAPRIGELAEMFGRVLDNPQQFSRVCVDNAAGAMSRLLLAKHQIPIDQAFASVVRNLPNKEDFEESGVCTECVLRFVQNRHSAVLANLPMVLTALAWGIGNPKVGNQAFQATIVQGIRFLKLNHEQQFQRALSGMNPSVAQKLSQL